MVGAIVMRQSSGATVSRRSIGRPIPADSADGISNRPQAFADSDKRPSRMASEFDYGPPCCRTRAVVLLRTVETSCGLKDREFQYGHCQRFDRLSIVSRLAPFSRRHRSGPNSSPRGCDPCFLLLGCALFLAVSAFPNAARNDLARNSIRRCFADPLSSVLKPSDWKSAA